MSAACRSVESRVIEARRDEAERLGAFFEVQLLFADALAARTGRPLAEVCLEFTNLHRRLGFGRTEGGAPGVGWRRYAEGLERCASGPDRVAWTVDCFAEATPQASDTPRFGCFSYEVLTDQPVVRIHFDNRDSDDGRGPLCAAKVERRRAELGEMFAHIRARHPQAEVVKGGSWLYNLDAYRRLFPPAYAASVFRPERLRLDGTSSWGQLLDFHGQVKPAIRQALLDNLSRLDVDAPWEAFPLRALGAQCEIEAFYQDLIGGDATAR